MKHYIEKITPSLANEWILCSPEYQRKLNPRHIATLQVAIERGEWRENGETIKFNKKNELIDGQHRLGAIIAAKRAVRSLVVTDLSAAEGVFLTLGNVRSRNYSDFVHVPHAQAVAAAAKFYWGLANDEYPEPHKHPPVPDLKRLCGHWEQEMSDACTEAYQAGRVTHQPSWNAFLLWYYRHILEIKKQKQLSQFFKALGDGIDLQSGSPILAVRNRLQSKRNPNETILPAVIRAVVLKGLHHHLNGVKVRRIGWDISQEEFPRVLQDNGEKK